MAIAELIASVQKLSRIDKLRLMELLARELLQAEDLEKNTESESANGLKEAKKLQKLEEDSTTLADRYAFLKKPLAVRRKIMTSQAEALETHYVENSEWRELMAGDIVEY